MWLGSFQTVNATAPRVAPRDGLGEVGVVARCDPGALAVRPAAGRADCPARRPERDVDRRLQPARAGHLVDAVERAPRARRVLRRIGGVEAGRPGERPRRRRDLRPARGHAHPVDAERAQVVERRRDALRRAVQELGVVLDDGRDRWSRGRAGRAAARHRGGERERGREDPQAHAGEVSAARRSGMSGGRAAPRRAGRAGRAGPGRGRPGRAGPRRAAPGRAGPRCGAPPP